VTIHAAAGVCFELHVPVLIIGAGACGLIAALAAHDAGAEVLVLERDAQPSGSTALSSGMVPACGTRVQAARGVSDSVALMMQDIQAKNGHRADPVLVERVCRDSAPAIDWLMERHSVNFELVEGFLYPGHSVSRMHAPKSRTGAALMSSLLAAARRASLEVVTQARVGALFADDDGRVRGVSVSRPDGSEELIGCDALVLACNGFGGNRNMVRQYIPEMAEADYFGHAGNQGDAVNWGVALGGEAVHMGAYQGHGSVAVPQGILITWALMMEGGIQVNRAGKRFSNEHAGYSEQSVKVLAQPDGLAWNIYDERLHRLGRDFEDYRNAEKMGAVKQGESEQALAAALGLPAEPLARSLADTHKDGVDSFGRDLGATPPLSPPYYGIKVTGALFHTQGGLRIDPQARVLRAKSGAPLPNLFAGGGAACGISGPEVSGYLSGNGLLTAVVLGRIAGYGAAAICRPVHSKG